MTDTKILKAPENVTGCGHAGVSYSVIDGLVEVPVHAVTALLDHGFTVYEKVEKVIKKKGE